MEYVVGIVTAAILVGWIGGVVALIFLWSETDDWRYGLLGAALLVVGFGLLFGSLAEQEAKSPCAAYEVQNRYNPAIKSYAPMRVCVERGEWVAE